AFVTGPNHFADRYDEPDQLRDQLRRLLRHRALIALGIFLGLLGGCGFGLQSSHTYTSTSDVLVRSTSDPFGTVTLSADNQVSMGTEQQVAASTAVADRAARELGQTTRSIQSHLRVTNPPKTQILRFEFTDRTARRAAFGANAFAQAYLADRQSRNDATVRRAANRLNQQITALNRKIDKRSLDNKPAAGQQSDNKPAADQQSDNKLAADAALDSVSATMKSEVTALQQRVSDISSRDTTGGDVEGPSAFRFTGRLLAAALSRSSCRPGPRSDDGLAARCA
ncbi:hypothetical protein AB0N17_45830, partial [Streptomyces sp. NPDC051133]